jgi:Hint domain
MAMNEIRDAGTAQRTRRNFVKIVTLVSAATLAMFVRPDKAKAAVCFLRGTMIRTAKGDRRVEDLAIGDMLPTISGGLRPIKWVGRYSLKKSDPAKPWVKDVLPVRVARSAIAPNLPADDLYVTAAHGLYVDGFLVRAGSLINGTTITIDRCEGRDELAYFHIKLDSHDLIFAEALPCETLVYVTESATNFAEYFRLYGEQKEENWAPALGAASEEANRGCAAPYRRGLIVAGRLTSFETGSRSAASR